MPVEADRFAHAAHDRLADLAIGLMRRSWPVPAGGSQILQGAPT